VDGQRTRKTLAPSTVIEKARTACFNSGQRVEDHFVGIDQVVEIGSGAQRPVQAVMMSRYACYLVIQNADPAKEIVAVGQTYFAVQTRRQELSDAELEDQRRLAIRSELRTWVCMPGLGHSRSTPGRS
jgi:DNA-damage-inducible protein D